MNYELPSDTEIGDSMGPLEESGASKKGFLMFSKVKAGKEVSDKKAEDNEFDLSGVDMSEAITEFINMLDIDNKSEVAKYTTELYNRSVDRPK